MATELDARWGVAWRGVGVCWNGGLGSNEWVEVKPVGEDGRLSMGSRK